MSNEMKQKAVKAVPNRWFVFCILTLSGGIAFKLSSMKDMFYVPMQQFMGLTNTQIGGALSAYGIVQTIGLIFGIYICDMFSKKYMIGGSLIGLGAIGFAFAKMAQGFGMHVLAYSRHKKEGAAYDFIEQVSLDELLARSDFISLHTPHTPATEHMIDQNTIARMKDGVILINTARGALIDEQALADALASGKVLAAGLDVLTDEPPVHGSPLLTAPNTVITGHIAWLTRESRIRAIDMAIDNFRCYLEGHPVSIIN